MDDNKTYPVHLPEEDSEMYSKFKKTITEIRHFDLDSFSQSNKEKCLHCIYEPACDRANQ